MFCKRCGNYDNFRNNSTQRIVACKNPKCNNLVRNPNNYDYRGVDEIDWFAHHMLEKLNTPKNQVKPSWTNTNFETLITLLKAEVKELENEYFRQKEMKVIDNNALLSECCDVANFAMFIADNTCVTKTRKYLG